MESVDGRSVEKDGRRAVKNAQLEYAGVHCKLGVPGGDAGCVADNFASRGGAERKGAFLKFECAIAGGRIRQGDFPGGFHRGAPSFVSDALKY